MCTSSEVIVVERAVVGPRVADAYKKINLLTINSGKESKRTINTI